MKNERDITTIQITRKMLKAIKEDGFMGETYEDVLWRWKGRKDKREPQKSKVEDKV